MTGDRVDEGEVVADGCANLRQGDVLALPSLVLSTGRPGDGDPVDTPLGVAVLSQTCDVVRPSKERCLVAPVIAATPAEGRAIAKGQSPLLIPLGEAAANADVQRATSVPKSSLVGLAITARAASDAFGRDALEVSRRIGHAFSRFAFPDEVYPAFHKLRQDAQRKTGTDSAFGRVLDLVDDLRVEADQWARPGRRLRLWVIVERPHMVAADLIDGEWPWDAAHVPGLKPGERQETLSLDRVCQLILASVEAGQPAAPVLWDAFGTLVKQRLLGPGYDACGDEVAAFEVEVVSDDDMTYRQYKATESLDLEALSDASVVGR